MRDSIRACLYISIFLTTLIPLIHADSLYFPAVTGKAIFFFILIQFSLLLYAVHLAVDKHALLPKVSLVSVAVFVFIGTIGFSSFLGDNPAASIFGNFERMDGWLTLFHLGIFFFLITMLFTEEKIWERFFHVSLTISVIVFLAAATTYLESIGTNLGETRVDVFLGNATFLGTYAMLHVFLAGYFAAKHAPWSRLQLLFCALALLNVLTIIVSGTRAALLGLLAGAAIGFFVYFLHTDRIRVFYKLLITVVLLFIAISSVALMYSHRAQLENVPMVGRLLHLSPDTITQQPRYFIWKAALKGVQEKPLLGWGSDQFLTVYSHYYSPETKSRFNVAIGETWNDRAHNMYLEWLLAGGPLALASYLFLFGYALYIAAARLQANVLVKASLIGLFCAYMVNNLFAFDSLSTHLLFFTLIGYIHYKAPPVHLPFTILTLSHHIKNGLACILIVLVAWLMYTVTIQSYSTAHTLADALKAEDGSPQQEHAFDILTSTSVYSPWHVTTVLAEDVRGMLKTKALEPRIAAQFAEVMQQQIKDEVSVRTLDARALFVYCKTIREMGDLEYAKILCESAAKQAPHTQEVLIELGQIYRALGMYETSLDVLARAFESEPEYDVVRPEYAAALIHMDRNEEARAVLNARYGTHLVDDKSLLTAYVQTEAFADALHIIEKHIQEEPLEIGYHISRVSIYLKLGQEARAIAAVEDLMEVDANLQKTGEQLIEQIRSGEAVLGGQFSLE